VKTPAQFIGNHKIGTVVSLQALRNPERVVISTPKEELPTIEHYIIEVGMGISAKTAGLCEALYQGLDEILRALAILDAYKNIDFEFTLKATVNEISS